MDGRLALSCSVALVFGSSESFGSSLALWIALSSLDWIFTSLNRVITSLERMLIQSLERMLIQSLERIMLIQSIVGAIGLSECDSLWSNDAGDLWWECYYRVSADSVCKMSKIKPSDKPKSSVYSKNGRIGHGISTSLSFFFELCFPELALAIDPSKVSICIILFGMVALAEISLQVRVKKHGQGQSSSGPAGGSGAGNAGGSIGGGGDENGIIGHGIGEGRRSGIGGGEQRRGNGDDDDNDGGRIVGNVENGRRQRNPTPEEIANIFLPIIIQSIAIIMSLDEAELSTTGRVIQYFSMVINLVGFICCAAVLWQPYTNPRVARILNPRISGILSRIGSALAVLGFISMMGINLPLYRIWIVCLAFLALLAIFLVDISEARQ